MDIKERFYANLAIIREDYDKGAADDAKELKNIGSGKVSRKSDKKIQKRFRDDARKAAKKAVTGMDEEAKNIEEVLDTAAQRKNYQDKAEASFKSAFGKKDYKSGHTVSKRLEGLRMSLRKNKKK